MKGVIQVCWILAACICLSEARYKMRRPLTPPSQPGPQIYKKSWPMAHRMSMGNTIHIGGNHGHKRPLYKPSNYRVRRPPMYNGLPTAWKNQIPILGVINTHAVLPQRPPVKEFHSMNKVPEYSPEYRPETVVMPPTHRGGMDDDKGAIHTIPAPNLSLADKPYSLVEGNPSENNHDDQISHHQYSSDGHYSPNHSGTLGTNYGFGSLVTSPAPQRTVTNPVQSTKGQYEVTETNEIGSRDYHTVQPTFLTPEFDVTRLSTSPSVDLQTNELYVNHGGVQINPIKPGSVNGNIQFGNSNTPMQTNLHSSLHVGFPGSAAQAPSLLGQQIPDLHVGHPAPAGPPLSATQLYDLLNSFPQQLNEQYANGQHSQQLQQQILQQQLGQLFQPTGGVASFSQPQMHSFNYDEQANKRQQQQQQQLQQQQIQLQQQQQQEQQQILLDQGYGSGRVTADYALEPETAGSVSIPDTQGNNLNGEQVEFRGAETSDQADNHIEYEESNNQRGQNTYFNKVSNDASISTQFFTTLPNKEAAEKLAALAAAGNVNSHLIGQLRKQQQQQQQQQKFEEEQEVQSDQPLPSNHKGSEYQVNEFQEEDPAYESQQQYSDEQQEQFDRQQQIYDEQQNQYEQQIYDRHNFRQQQQTRHRQELNDRYEQQRLAHSQQNQDQSNEEENSEDDKNKRPMRIMVPDVEEYTEDNRQRASTGAENTSEDYDYENPESDVPETRTTSVPSSVRTTFEDNPNSEFGTRLTSKKGH